MPSAPLSRRLARLRVPLGFVFGLAVLILARPTWRSILVGALIGLAGEAVALEILLEGRVFDAREAKDKGLVTRVVPDGEVEAEAKATARRIADGAPLVARWHKKFARRLRDARPLTAEELDEGFACYGTEDFRIGRQAFLAKAKPDFKGR